MELHVLPNYNHVTYFKEHKINVVCIQELKVYAMVIVKIQALLIVE